MRGAVLSELGLRVGEHLMRRNYGVLYNNLFSAGDPVHRKFIDVDGLAYCKDYFDWFASMVRVPFWSSSFTQNQKFSYGHVHEQPLHRDFTGTDLAAVERFSDSLWVSDDKEPPQYKQGSIGSLVQA